VAVTSEMVKALREKTGAGMMDCKRALEEAHGDEERAIRLLREKGLAQVAKKASRQASEGVVTAYLHGGGRIGVLVEVRCETDFVARNPDFQALGKELAMQVAASSPRYVHREDVPPEEVERERSILRAQAEASGKPPQVVQRMVEGRLEKFFADVCLLDQPSIRDPGRKVAELVAEQVHRMGENIQVQRFVRYEVGGGAIVAERVQASGSAQPQPAEVASRG
jgi:elongation factor Ts